MTPCTEEQCNSALYSNGSDMHHVWKGMIFFYYSYGKCHYFQYQFPNEHTPFKNVEGSLTE